jgi:hypothetical protein
MAVALRFRLGLDMWRQERTTPVALTNKQPQPDFLPNITSMELSHRKSHTRKESRVESHNFT